MKRRQQTKNIVSFSGGKDSTAMLLMMIEKGIKIDHIVFVDTTKEFPEIYNHISKIEDYIKPLEIDWLKIDFDYWFGEHIKTRGKNKGKKGYGWADFRTRWCTRLKSVAIRKYTNKIDGYKTEYVGIAYDERQRAENFKPKDRLPKNVRFPLVEWKITEEQALEYCYEKGFDWDSLYEHIDRASCFCCPLSKIEELKYVYNCRPELWKEIRTMDKKSYRDFRPDYTLEELEERVKND